MYFSAFYQSRIFRRNSIFCLSLMISLMACQVSVFPPAVLHLSSPIIPDISCWYCFVEANEASPRSRNYVIPHKPRRGRSDRFGCSRKMLKIIICKCVKGVKASVLDFPSLSGSPLLYHRCPGPLPHQQRLNSNIHRATIKLEELKASF